MLNHNSLSNNYLIIKNNSYNLYRITILFSEIAIQ